MDAFFGGLYKDLYRVSSKAKNPLFMCTGTFLLFLGIVLFLLWPTNVVIKHFIGVALLILAWTLALNYKPIDMMGVRSDPSIDPQNEIGSVVSNYLLLITRLMVVCVVLYYSIKICVIVVESFKEYAVFEYFYATNNPYISKLYWGLLQWVPFVFLGWTILGVSKTLKRLMPSWNIVSDPINEFAEETLKTLSNLSKNQEAIYRAYLYSFINNVKNKQDTDVDENNLKGLFNLEELKNKIKNGDFFSTGLDMFIVKVVEKKIRDKILDLPLGDKTPDLPLENLSNNLDTSMFFSYQKWIDLVHDNISKNISDFYGLLDFSKSWMTHGAAFVTGLVVVIVYFYAILNKQSCIDISTIITNTNQIAFATLLTFYLVTYLVRNIKGEK
jgi:hypothetical protein